MDIDYKGRVEKLRMAMELANVDFLLSFYPINQYYLTGTNQNQVLVLPRKGEPVLSVKRNLEKARQESWVRDIRPQNGMSDDLAQIGRELDMGRSSIGIEYNLTTVTTFKLLEKLFPYASIVNSDDIWLKCREIKESYEIDCFRKAQVIPDRIFCDIRSTLKEGVTEAELHAQTLFLAAKYGSEGFPVFYGVGGRTVINRCGMGRVVSGALGAVPADYPVVGGVGFSRSVPNGPSNKKIVRGDQVTIDIGGMVEGYTSDSTRTFFLGPPSEKLRDMYDTTLEAQEIFFKGARPGVAIGELVKSVLRRVEERGYLRYFMGPFPYNGTVIGHGVGLFINEYPIPVPGSREVFQPGMVLAIEPKVAVPGIGSVEVEEIIVITEDGNEMFSTFPRELEELILNV